MLGRKTSSKDCLEIQNYDKVTASALDGWQKRKAKAESAGDSYDVEPRSTNIMELVGRSKYPPGSNHYGALLGGVTVALLAIEGDPGVNPRMGETTSGRG